MNIVNNKPTMIVLDLDGTALTSKNLMTNNLQKILISLRQNNKCRIVLASGRSISSMKKIAHNLGLETPVITLNGGVIIDSNSNSIFYEKNLPTNIYKESLQILKKLDVDSVIFTSSAVYADKPSHITEILEKYTDNTIEWINNYQSVKSPVKILFIPESREAIASVKKHTLHLDIDIIDSGFRFVEIVPKGVNKGAALKMVSEMVNIRREDIISFGDNENDIEMLQFAGTGVAMDNAPDHVKAEGDIVAETNDNDGVYKVLKQIFDPVEDETI